MKQSDFFFWKFISWLRFENIKENTIVLDHNILIEKFQRCSDQKKITGMNVLNAKRIFEEK